MGAQAEHNRMTESLPTNTDAERFVLGSVMLEDSFWPAVSASLSPDDFSLEKHRRIYRRMGDMAARGEKIDRITVANELMKHGELESVDGLSYLVSLDDGLPQIPNIDEYIGIVKKKATLRAIIFASQHIANRALRGEDEPEAILAGASSTYLQIAEGCAQSTLVTPAQIIDAAGGIGAYIDRKTRATGISTGYPALDVMTGGLQPGKLYVLAARPAMGKTAFALNIGERVAFPERGESEIVCVFSLEMAKEELLDRLICSRARINTQRFTGGFMSQEEERRAWRSASEIAVEDRIYIDDKANTTDQEIWAKVRKQQARGKVGLVIVDYLQLMLNCKHSERVAAMSSISRNMKLIAKDCKVPVMALSQLSRACETRGSESNPDGYRPVLSDIRESGSIEQDADVVASLIRMEVYLKERPELHGRADLELLKQRGGPIGRIPMTWIAEFVRFEEGEPETERSE